MTIVRGGIVRSRPELVRSIVFSRGGTPPAPLSATVLADGVTLRLVFDQAIISGSATDGMSRSVGTISSGTYSGVNLDLTIPKVYSGDSVGTISYTPGTLAGAGGAVAAFGPVAITNNSTQVAWSPASLPGIVDYGIWSDLSHLISADGVNPVVSAGDPVRKWLGQLGSIYYENTTTGTMPLYTASGIRFGGQDIDGSAKSYSVCNATFNIQDTRCHFDSLVKGPSNLTATAHYNAGDSRFHMYAGVSGSALFQSRGAYYSRAFDQSSSTRRRVGIAHVSGQVYSYIDGSKVSHGASGSETGAVTTFSLAAYDGTGYYRRAWVMLSQGVSDENYALLDAWLEGI